MSPPWYTRWGPVFAIVFLLLAAMLGLIPSHISRIPEIEGMLHSHIGEAHKMTLFGYIQCVRLADDPGTRRDCDNILRGNYRPPF